MPRKRVQNGEGPVWDWIKNTGRKAHDLIKDNRLISRGASFLAPIAGPYSNIVRGVGTAAHSLGYGKKLKKRRKKRKGRPKKK